MTELKCECSKQGENVYSEGLLEAAWNRRVDLLNKAWATVRYHRRRESFFDFLDKGNKVITVALAMTFLTELEKICPLVKPVAAASIGALTLIDLIYGYNDKKNLHQHIAEKATDVIATIESVPLGSVTPPDAAAWGAMYAQVVATEPPVLKNLKLICEREQFISEGKLDHANQHCPELSLMQRFFADFFSIPPHEKPSATKK